MTTTLVGGTDDAGTLDAGLAAGHPNLVWAQAHLAGRMTGRRSMVAERTELLEVGGRLCFLAGTIDAAALAAAARALRPRRTAMLVLPPGTDLDALTVPDGFRAGLRQHFRGRSRDLRRELTGGEERERRRRFRADGYGLRRLRPSDIDDPLLRETMLEVYGAAEHFRAGPELGFCATHEGRMVSWMHPVVGAGAGEVGAGTAAEHRGRGLSGTLVFVTARAMAQAGLDVTASWMADLEASWRLSRHASLRHEFDYPVLVRDGR